MADVARVTALELRDGRLWSGDRRVICHPADHDDLMREIARGGSVEVLLSRPVGRPRVERAATTKIHASVPPDIAEALRARASSEGRTPSSCVREALERWLEQPEE